jgi:hypothetical protein
MKKKKKIGKWILKVLTYDEQLQLADKLEKTAKQVRTWAEASQKNNPSRRVQFDPPKSRLIWN